MSDEGLEARQLLHKLWRGKIPTEEQAWPYIRPDEDYHDHLLRRVYTVLRRSLYYATAYPLGGTTRERIPADLWTVLEIHPPSGRAMGAGHEYWGLRFYEVKPEPKKTTAAKTACLEWPKELMTTGDKGGKNKDDYWGEASAKFPGLSHKSFKDAWAEACAATSSGWDKAGLIEICVKGFFDHKAGTRRGIGSQYRLTRI